MDFAGDIRSRVIADCAALLPLARGLWRRFAYGLLFAALKANQCLLYCWTLLLLAIACRTH